MGVEVDFEPIGRRVDVEAGATLLDAAQQAGVMLTAICGGEGSCGRCIVRVMSGEVSPPNDTEEYELGEKQIAAGWRLACQARIAGVGDNAAVPNAVVPNAAVRVHVPPD